MSGESLADLSDDLREWVESHASETDQDPSDVLTQAITAYRLLEDEEDTLAENGDSDVQVALHGESELLDQIETLQGRVDELETLDQRVEDLQSEIDEKIQDVRERVIQVKQETDSKAPKDHEHGQLRREVEESRRVAEEAAETSQELKERMERIDQGFSNFEEILEYLTETTDELEEKLDRLAYVVIDLRGSVGELEGTAATRAAAADLKEEANREGITAAKCGSCESKVLIGHLSTPHCPHCETTFREVEPAEGLFGSAYLRPGDRPALQGGDGDSVDSPEDLFDEYDDADGGN